MVTYAITDTQLTAIADAIRLKRDIAEHFEVDDMPLAISLIDGGSYGDPTLVFKTEFTIANDISPSGTGTASADLTDLATATLTHFNAFVVTIYKKQPPDTARSFIMSSGVEFFEYNDSTGVFRRKHPTSSTAFIYKDSSNITPACASQAGKGITIGDQDTAFSWKDLDLTTNNINIRMPSDVTAKAGIYVIEVRSVL